MIQLGSPAFPQPAGPDATTQSTDQVSAPSSSFCSAASSPGCFSAAAAELRSSSSCRRSGAGRRGRRPSARRRRPRRRGAGREPRQRERVGRVVGVRVVHDHARVVLGHAGLDRQRAGRRAARPPSTPSAPKRSGWPCSIRMVQSSRVSGVLEHVERAVVEDVAVLVDLDQRGALVRRRPRAAPTAGACGRSPACGATKVASAPRATEIGLNGESSEPIGEDLVILPSSDVGEYWPLVRP